MTWRTKATFSETARRLFVTIGILPFLLVITFLALGLIQRRFWSPENIFNVFRQSSYLCVVAMAQMLVLLTGNYDLSVGANIALGAIVMNLVAVLILGAYPDAPIIAIVGGIVSALATGIIIGIINGIGVALMKVHSFIMTLGMMSVALGIALFLSGGMPGFGSAQKLRSGFCLLTTGRHSRACDRDVRYFYRALHLARVDPLWASPLLRRQ